MLYVYRASAGSGKTFLLTGFYIQLLFRHEQGTSLDRELLFKEILAVTFTNKATAEMKERIIKDLHTLSINPKESAYYEDLRMPDKHGKVMSDEAIRKKAQTILRDMLTDYSSLHISTIDSFFQQVVRSFAHELNIQGSFEVELDSDMVLDHAVSQFLLNLDPVQDKETFDWMLRYTNQQLEQGAKWNVHKELLKLAKKVLLSEDYRRVSELVGLFTSDKEMLADYQQKLNETINSWRQKLKKIGQDCCQWASDHNISLQDFYSGYATIFLKWANGNGHMTDTIQKWAEDSSIWFKGDSPYHQSVSEADKEVLKGLIAEAVYHICGDGAINYNSALLIRKNIFQLGILNQLDRAANDYCAEHGVKLLSSTTQMLNALVVDQSAPFIYEKTGTRISSYMIDEFQDTSGMQWQNFAPLLEESLSTEHRNLIVGDVKQSIYRWRGSDWELLHSKLKAFRHDQQAYDKNGNQLKDNWRSDRAIIQFNNEFFRFASQFFGQTEQDNAAMKKIADIYEDVEQTISDVRKEKYIKKGMDDVPAGEVTFEILADDSKEKRSYESLLEERLPEMVMALQQKGFRAQDILILCRLKEQCHLCAKSLLDYQAAHPDCPYNLKIVTQEALLLYRQGVVRALIAVLEYLHDPSSLYQKAIAGICWLQLSCDSYDMAVEEYFHDEKDFGFENLLNLPLFEMVERLILMLPESARGEQDFIQAFSDVVLDYIAKEGPNLDGFLSWWSTHGINCSVTTPSNQDAIRIMTIHQSKGLDGGAVIVPFSMGTLDIELSGNKAPLLWCEPKEETFARPGLILPITLSSDVKLSIFKEEYNEERVRAIIDNLNTVYVAFTRAKHFLGILSPAPSKDKKSNPFTQEKLLKTFFDNHKEHLSPVLKYDEDMPYHPQGEELPEIKEEPVSFELQDNPIPLIKKTEYQVGNAAARGTTLHAAFSAIIDYTQIEEPITRLFRSGAAQLEGITLPEVIEYVNQAISTPEARPWFSPENRVMNEQDILTSTTHTQRPDRIVFTPDGRVIIIDFKTGAQEERHKKQVQHYMKLMRQMSFSNVEGYLWYIEENQIIKVEQ